MDVHDLHSDRPAVCGPHHLDVLTSGGLLQPQHLVDEDRAVHVGFGEAVGLGVELGMRLDRLEAERVEIGFQVAAHAVGPDQHEGADGIRSEEHTSELQSLMRISYAVFCLKKKKKKNQ